MDLNSALAQRPKVEQFRRKHRIGLLTLLFTDIVGSTKLKQDLGDHRAIELIQRHHEKVRQVLSLFTEGEEIDTAGDSFFLLFTKPSDAARFALLLQSQLRSLAKETGIPIFDRIGIHVGEVFIDETGEAKDKDLYGIQVDTCGRIMALGQADQILLSRFAFDNARQVLKGQDVEGLGPLSWLNHGSYVAKGVEEPLEICEVGEASKAVLALPPDSDKAKRQMSNDAEPVLGWRPAIGQTVPNTNWVLEKKLGEGGFGEVWLGLHTALKERRVFKFCFRADRVRSLKREVTLFKLLKEKVGEHPNIVGIRDVFFEEPPYYLIMDYADGVDLCAWCQAQGGPDKVSQAAKLEIIAQVADGLQAAHESGIIHRDIKPSNILIVEERSKAKPGETPKLQVLLTDFGVGQVVSLEVLYGMTQLGFSQTQIGSGSVSQTGTHLYMAPELLAGGKASIRSDIYSLGIVLFQLLAGDLSRPVTTDWAKEIVDPLLREDLGHCFAGKPEERFASMAQLAASIRNLAERQQRLAQQQAEIAARESLAYRRGIIRTVAFASILLLLLISLTIFAFHQRQRADLQAAQTRDALVQTYISNGSRLLAERDSFGALVWYANAYATDSNDPERVKIHQMRANSLLADAPGLLQMLFFDSAISDVSFDPACEKIAVSCRAVAGRPHAGDKDRQALVFEAATGKQLLPPLTNSSFVWRSFFSPAGKSILTINAGAGGGGREEMQFWNSDTGSPLTMPVIENGWINSTEFSPDGTLILVATHHINRTNSIIRVVNCTTGQGVGDPLLLTGSVDVHFASSLSAALVNLTHSTYSKDQNLWQEDGKEVLIWDFKKNQVIEPPWLKANKIIKAALSPNGEQAAVLDTDQNGLVLDTRSGTKIVGPFRKDPNQEVSQILFSRDGRFVITSGWNREEEDPWVRVWDSATGGLISTVAGNELILQPNGEVLVQLKTQDAFQILECQKGEIVVPRIEQWQLKTVKLSDDGRLLSTAGWDGTARIWDLSQQSSFDLVIHTADSKITDACFDQAAEKILVVTEKTVQLWDAQTGRPIKSPIEHEVHGPEWQGWGLTGSFSSDGTRVLLSNNKGARVWDPTSPTGLGPILKHNLDLVVARFSPDGTRVLTAGGGATMEGGEWYIWNARTGQKMLAPKKQPEWKIMAAEFSPDGKRFVTASQSIVSVYDANTGELLGKEMEHKEGNVLDTVVFSPDGQRVLSAGWNGYARLWKVTSAQELIPPLKHSTIVHRVLFSPDNDIFLTISGNDVRLYDSRSGRPISPPLKHEKKGLSEPLKLTSQAVFSHDGSLVATSVNEGGYGYARIWNTKTGVPITPWLRHRPSGEIHSIHLSPDGHRLLTASLQGVVVWRLPEIKFTPDDLLRLSRLLAHRVVDSTGNLSSLQTDPEHTTLSTTVEAIQKKIPQAPLPSLVQMMKPRELEKDWDYLKQRYPNFFTPSKERTANWHRLEALRLMNTQPEAALKHLNWLTNYATPTEADARLRQNCTGHAVQLSNVKAGKANK